MRLLNYVVKTLWDILNSFEAESRYGGDIVGSLTIADEILPKIEALQQQIEADQREVNRRGAIQSSHRINAFGDTNDS